AARAHGAAYAGDENLEVDPRVVVEPAHLAEVVHDMATLVVGERRVDGAQPIDRGDGVGGEARGAVEGLAPADDERERLERATQRRSYGGESGGVLAVDEPAGGGLAVGRQRGQGGGERAGVPEVELELLHVGA